MTRVTRLARVGLAALLLAGCAETHPCPPRDGEALARTLVTSAAPRPWALEVAQGWAPSAGVHPSLAPRIAFALPEHSISFPFWELLVRVAPAYTQVADEVAARGLPVALAAIPLSLSMFEPVRLGDRRAPDHRISLVAATAVRTGAP